MKKTILSLISLLIINNVANAANSIEEVRIGENSGKTRIVFQASKNDTITLKKVFQLQTPARLVIDLASTNFKADTAHLKIDARSQISEIRHGIFTPSTHRIVVDLKRGVKYKYFKLPQKGSMGERLVVDLMPTDNATYYKPSPKSTIPDKITVNRSSNSIPKKGNFVIMIDAGHGGVDPGAVGKTSRGKVIYEKNITLSIAKKLQREINKYPNMTAYLTRSTDTFVPLRTRIKRATKKHADLFISIHADAHNNKRVRGGSVYILSENSSDKEAARLARIANRGDEVAGVILKNEARDIQSILIDLTQRESMNKSALLAQDILRNMKDVVQVKHSKAKFAGFVVLKSADIPSILIESSYISNPTDLAILISPTKQNQLARSIARGVNSYLLKNY